MTWLPGVAAAGNDWDALASRWPKAMDALAGLVRAAWEDTDPSLLELARLRTATLLRNEAELASRTARAGLSEDKVAQLPAWPSSPLFDDRERACLAFTEQFIMDANGVTQGQVDALTGHLGPEGCYAFVHAVSALEAYQRACLTLGIAGAPGVDDLEEARA